MNENTFEVNDEYLEHLFGLGYKKERKNHKYIKKIDTPKGTRYFYTQADLKAYYAGLRAKDKLGFDERERRNTAKSTFEKAAMERQKRAVVYSNSRYSNSSNSLASIIADDRRELDKARAAEVKAKEDLDKYEKEYAGTALGKFENLIQAVKKFGKKKVSDLADFAVKKLADIYDSASEPFKAVADTIIEKEVEEYPVTKSLVQRDEQSIIERLCGGDITRGSCVSLALAYTGNKAGYDVIDFRGGSSQETFSKWDSIKDIAMLSDVDSQIIDYDTSKKSPLDATNEILKDALHGPTQKEYLLATGGHMAVVRKTATGLQYLELQSGSNTYPNGWHTLDDSMLINRFCVQPYKDRHSIFMHGHQETTILIDVETLGKSTEFSSLLSYINTPESEQQKGSAGHVK